MKYDVFISYSRKDSEIADRICGVLEDNDIKYFIDRSDISGGEEFSSVLIDAIEDSTVFLFLGSKNSYSSKWTSKELHFALNHKDRVAIIPYLIDGEPLPSDIEFKIADLNIRFGEEHPVESVLLNDIKTALEKMAPKDGKEDMRMVKSIIEQVLSSSHSKTYNIQLLTELGDFSVKSGRSQMSVRPREAKEFYIAALDLSKQYLKNRFEENFDVAELYSKVAKIDKELEKYSEAEIGFCQAVGIYRKECDKKRMYYRYLFDSLINLAETRFCLQKYDLAEQSCMDAKSCLLQLKTFRLSDCACQLCELYANVLRKQGRAEEVSGLYDEILSLFRDKQDESKVFPDMLYSFAKSNFKYKNYSNALKYLKEATSLDGERNTTILLDLAKAYEAMEQLDQAAQVYEDCFACALKGNVLEYQRPEVASIVSRVTSFMNRIKRYTTVDKYFQLAIAKYTVDIFDAHAKENKLEEIYEMYADWLIDRQRFTDALRYLKLCDSISVDTLKPHLIRLRLASKQARVLFSLDLKKEALDCLEQELAADRDKFEAEGVSSINILYSIIIDLQRIGFSEAVSMVQSYLIDVFETRPTEDLSYGYETALGWYLMLLGDYQVAEKHLEKALDLSQTEDEYRANAKNNLGRLFACTGRFEKAEKLLNEALVFFQKAAAQKEKYLAGYAESLSYLGLAYMNLGNNPAAVIYLEKAIDAYQQYEAISDNRNNDLLETEKWLEKAKANL